MKDLNGAKRMCLQPLVEPGRGGGGGGGRGGGAHVVEAAGIELRAAAIALGGALRGGLRHHRLARLSVQAKLRQRVLRPALTKTRITWFSGPPRAPRAH